jgi:tetratricopeptide (TPR) repeat protein
MCRSAAEVGRQPAATRYRIGGAMLLLFLLAPLSLPAPATALPPPNTGSGFELSRGTQRALFRLQESWLQWVSAIYRDNEKKSQEALAMIEANSRQVGMTRLVDFSLGAVAMALESARDGNFPRAGWALAAAEKLDPGRPETAFARASIERRRGALFASIGSAASGFRRLLAARERNVLLADLAFWWIAVLLVAGALFVLLQVAAKGSAVVADLGRWLSRKLSPATVWLASTVILLWPLMLPGGPLWLLLYWSALLWGYANRSERVVIAAIWLVTATGPWLATQALERIAIELSPPMRAVSHFAEGRLYGGLFADLDVLRTAIGERPAGRELLGDVHRTLGQWEESRQLYRQVLEVEPRNAEVLINLGAYAFRKSDFAAANEYFQRAAASASSSPRVAAALYNLSLSYSETYQFEESRSALAQARQTDSTRVDHWVKVPNVDRALTFDGGIGRIEEVERELDAARGANPFVAGTSRFGGFGWNVLALGVVAAFAAGLTLYRGGRGYSEPVSWLPWRTGLISKWLRVFFPALSQAELGEGARAMGSLLGLTMIVLAPRLFTLGIDVPILGGLGSRVPWFLALAGLAAYIAVCLRGELLAGKRV